MHLYIYRDTEVQLNNVHISAHDYLHRQRRCFTHITRKKIYTDLHILAYPHRHTYLQCSATSYMHMDLYGRMSAWVIKPIKIARP